MPFLCLGLSHHTAPLAVRERIALDGAAWPERLGAADLRAGLAGFGVAELGVLSTCNRTELYLAGDGAGPPSASAARALLARLTGVPTDEVAPHLYELRGPEAARHLCRVAVGLESMVIGESEVLGQVTRAHEGARRVGALGARLDALFRAAVRAGRRARAETAIGRRPGSIASEAVRVLASHVGPLDGCRVALVGTGKMSRTVGRILAGKGVTRLHVIGRTVRHAERLADGIGATAHPWHELEGVLARVDAVISSTAAPHPVLTHELVMAARRDVDAPLAIVDIALPRDVEPAVRELPGVSLHDLDAVQAGVAEHLDARREGVAEAERVIEEELASWTAAHETAQLRPVLAALHAHADAIREREVARAMRHARSVDPVLREVLDACARAVVAKLLDPPSRRLRAERDPAAIRALAAALRAFVETVPAAAEARELAS